MSKFKSLILSNIKFVTICTVTAIIAVALLIIICKVKEIKYLKLCNFLSQKGFHPKNYNRPTINGWVPPRYRYKVDMTNGKHTIPAKEVARKSRRYIKKKYKEVFSNNVRRNE